MNRPMVYAWKQPGRISVPADVAGAELNRIRAEQGRFFTPAAVVHASRPEDAPLHPAFEWNDAKAAQAHRETQAKEIIRSIVVVPADQSDAEPVRAFVSVQLEDEGHRYTTTTHALAVADLREQVLAQALRDMQAFQRRYGQFLDLSGVREAFDRARIEAGAEPPSLAAAD